MAIPTFITLSTIPSRFGLIRSTLESLLSQSLPAQAIQIYIPRHYRRFPNWDGVLPKIPDGVTVVRCDQDLGPATKVLPAARAYKGQNVHILFCDDDKIYDKEWHSRFKNAAEHHPNTCICEVGETLPDIADACRPSNRLPRGRRTRKDWRYRLIRALTLARYKPHTYTNDGYVDFFSGYGGVLVQPDWFDDLFYDIPSIMWTVDDPWISGHLERRNIPIWLNGKGKRPGLAASGHIDALVDLVQEGKDRSAADIQVINYFRDTYGIWTKCGAVDTDYSRMTKTLRVLAKKRIKELAKL